MLLFIDFEVAATTMQREPRPLAFAQLALVAVGVVGLVYFVLGGGRKPMDYALGAVVLFAGGFAISMAVIALGWVLDSVVGFFEARKNRSK